MSENIVGLAVRNKNHSVSMFFLFRMENKKFLGAKQPTWQAFEREREEDSRRVRREKGERGVWRPNSFPLPYQTPETNLLIKQERGLQMVAGSALLSGSLRFVFFPARGLVHSAEDCNFFY